MWYQKHHFTVFSISHMRSKIIFGEFYFQNDISRHTFTLINSHSLPQVSLIPSIFTFCIKCLLYPNSFQYYPYLHHVLQCLPSQHSFSLQGSKRIQRVLDRVIWQNFKVVQPVQTCRESFLIKSGVWMSSWGVIYWNGINAAQNLVLCSIDTISIY